MRLSSCTLADRKSTRLNSSHVEISYAVFCLKKTKSHGSAGDSGAEKNPKYRVQDSRGQGDADRVIHECKKQILADIPHSGASHFFFKDTPTTEIYTLSLHDALPISPRPVPTPSRSGSGRARSAPRASSPASARSEEHTSELQSRRELVCRLLLEKKKIKYNICFFQKNKKNKAKI